MKKTLLLSVCLFSGVANAIVLDFDAFTGSQILSTTGVFGTEDGFNLALISGPGYICASCRATGDNTLSAYRADNGATAPVYQFSRIDGGLFTVDSWDFRNSNINSGSQNTQSVSGFIGATLISADSFTTVNNAWNTYISSNLSGMAVDKVLFTVYPGNSQKYLDNVTVTAKVPEPAMLTLLGIGLFGMGLSRRRNKS